MTRMGVIAFYYFYIFPFTFCRFIHEIDMNFLSDSCMALSKWVVKTRKNRKPERNDQRNKTFKIGSHGNECTGSNFTLDLKLIFCSFSYILRKFLMAC